MSLAQPLGFTQDSESRSPDPRSSLPLTPTEAMLRQAEVDAAYLAVEAARADPIYQGELRAKAIEARERAHRLRAAIKETKVSIETGEPEAFALPSGSRSA
jgi:hypothetical protein